MQARAWIDSLIWTFFPAHCRHCEQPLGLSRVPYFCDTCWEQIAWIDPPYCAWCGMPLQSAPSSRPACASCVRHRPPFRLRALARYEGAIREAIHLFKYEHKPILAKHFERAIHARIARVRELLPADAVLPVPLHRRRYRQRGFNQAALLASSVADALGLPLLQGVLARTRDTRPQSSLTSAEERKQNIRGAFAVVNPEAVAGQSLLLVDDIYTTGATVQEAARTLLRAGAREVNVFTLTRA